MAKDFKSLGESPLQSAERLSNEYHFLTAAVYEQIKSLEEQGRKDEAATLAQKTYADAMGDRAKQTLAHLGPIEKAWKDAGDAAKGAWDYFLNIGREETLQQQLEKVQANIKAAQRNLYSYANAASARERLPDLRQQEANLQGQIDKQNEANKAKDAANKLDNARIEWLKEGEKYQTRQEQLETDITKARTLGAAAGKSQADIEVRVGEVRKKYADLFNDGIDSQIEAIKRRGVITEEVEKRSQALLNANHAAGLVNEKDYVEGVAQLEVAALAKRKVGLQEELALAAKKQNSQKEQAGLRGQIAQIDEQITTRQIELQGQLLDLEVKNNRAAADAFASVVDRQLASRDALKEQLTAQRDSNEQIGLNARGIADLTAARLEDRAAFLEQNADIAEGIDLSGQLSETYREQAKLLRDLAAAKREGALKEVGADAARATADEWKRAAGQIENSLTDALMRGFESGKAPLKNLADTAVNLFKTMVLKPSIQGGITGTVGSSAPANAVQTATGLGNLYSTFTNVGGAVAGIGNLAGSTYISALGTGLSQGAAAGEAIATYQAAAAAGQAGAGAAASGLAAGSQISTAIAAIPGWGWAAMGAAALIGFSGIFGHGPEKDTRLTFTSNNKPGAISINERGNEGKTGQSYIDDFGTGAFGTFGVSSSFWMSSKSDVVQNFIHTVTAVDDALAGFLTDTEKASVKDAVTGKSTTAHTGVEGANPNANGQLEDVFKARLNVIFEGVAPGLSSLLDGFKGSSQELATEAGAILAFRKALGDTGPALFGATVTLQDLAKLKGETESTSAALNRVAAEFRTTNALIEAIGVTSSTAFGAVGLASEAARKHLLELAGGADALAAQSQFFAQNFLSKAEQIGPAQKALNEELAKLGYTGLTTADQYKEAVLKLAQSGALATDEGAKTYTALLALGPAFKTVADYLKDSIKAVTDQLRDSAKSALDTLQSALDVERDAVTKRHDVQTSALEKSIDGVTASLSKLQSLSQALRSTLSGMQAPGMEQGDRVAAQAELASVLAKARAGGGLPDADKLKDVLSVLSRDASNQFSSYQDYIRDFYKTTSDLSGLAGITDTKVSTEQRMLDSLKAQKESLDLAYKKELESLDALGNNAKAQLDQLLGINNGVQGLAAAIAGFSAALGAVKAGASQSDPGKTNFSVTDLYKTVLGRDPDSEGYAFWTKAFGSSVDTSEIAEFIKGAAPELNAKGGRTWQEWLKALGIPGYATGGDFGGGLRLVGENGPELEVTGPSRIFNASQTSALLRPDNGEMYRALALLATRFEELKTVMELVQESSAASAEILIQVSAGGGPFLVEIAE